jgi:uncharacterized alpha/beta hydrolase family protein
MLNFPRLKSVVEIEGKFNSSKPNQKENKMNATIYTSKTKISSPTTQLKSNPKLMQEELSLDVEEK